MDTKYLTLTKICKEMIESCNDTIFRYELGQDIPKEVYDMAIESLPEWQEQLNKIETEWPTD